MNTGLDFDEIRTRMDAEDFEPTHDGFGYERRVYLGTVFRLTPSGKYYTPWANGNVAGCPTCGGAGATASRFKERVVKKRAARNHRAALRFFAAKAADRPASELAVLKARSRETLRQFRAVEGRSCRSCGGLGSREAFLDECWTTEVEHELDRRGMCLTSGEGDPCDLFATEYTEEPPVESALASASPG